MHDRPVFVALYMMNVMSGLIDIFVKEQVHKWTESTFIIAFL